MLTDKMPDNKVHHIRSDKKNGSWIEVFDVEHDRKGTYERMVEDMERYLVEDSAQPQTSCREISARYLRSS